MSRTMLRGGITSALTLLMQQAAPFETPIVGGGGGTPFADRCQPNEMMAGVSAVIGAGEVTSVAIVCQPLQAGGTLGPPGPARPRHGSAANGAPMMVLCPRGQVVRGMSVYYGDAVRGLGLYCRVWAGSSFGASGGGTETIGTSSGAMSPVACPPDGTQPAVGMAGTTTSRVVAVRLICDAPRR